jgi:hypothetical protein
VSEPVPQPADASSDSALATWPAPTPDLAEALPVELSPVDALADVAAAAAAANAANAVEEPAAAAEPAPAPVKERRRAPRKSSARKAAAPAAEAAAQDDAAVAADTVAAVDTAATDAAAVDTAAVDTADAGDEGGDAQADMASRKKPGRSAHKAPSRKPAARTRRPAKPKTPGEGA